MDNRGRRKIDYIKLIQTIAGHWKPVIQNKQFYWAMLKWLICMSAFTAFMIFWLSLSPTGKVLSELVKEIAPPPNAILTDHGGSRKGLHYFYKFPEMSGEEVRSYYKMELKKKNGSIKEKIGGEMISM